MQFDIENHFYTQMEKLCEKVDYLFEEYKTDGFIRYAMTVHSENQLALDLLKYSFEELDSDDRIDRCRTFIRRDYPNMSETHIVRVVMALMNTLRDWEQHQLEQF